jgi:hypothetical protein
VDCTLHQLDALGALIPALNFHSVLFCNARGSFDGLTEIFSEDRVHSLFYYSAEATNRRWLGRRSIEDKISGTLMLRYRVSHVVEL